MILLSQLKFLYSSEDDTKLLSDIELILSGFYSSGPNDQRGTIKYQEEDRFTLIAEFVDIYSSRNENFVFKRRI